MAARTKTRDTAQATLVVDNGASAVPAVRDKGIAPTPALIPADPLLSLIERASKDPTVDIDKMERLIAMHDRVKASGAQAEYDMAMSKAQSEMKTIKTNKSNSHTSSKYASYEAMDKAIRPIYAKHGFAMSFNTGDTPNAAEVRVLCTVSHRNGHRQEYRLDVPADGKGPKGDNVMTKTHATGSAISYGKRYLAGMVWNLSVGDDDDGNSAASIAERAQTMADNGIQKLNTANFDRIGLEKWNTENAKSIAWLKKNAPQQFERYQTAYSNAAEAAGIKREEPKRTKDQSSSAASPHGEPTKSGQPAKTSSTGAGGDSKPEAASTPASVTDVTDENDPIDFGTFDSARAFLDFSATWIAESGRTAAQAKQWHDKFKDKINEYLQHKFGWIKESMTDTFAVYVKITSAGNAS